MPREHGKIDKPLSDYEIKQLELYAGIGLNKQHIATLLGISKSCLEDRMKDTPGVKEAIDRGRAVAVSNVAKVCYEMAISGDHPSMTSFYLKTRGGWSEKMEVAHSNPDGTPLKNNITVKLFIPDNGKSKR